MTARPDSRDPAHWEVDVVLDSTLKAGYAFSTEDDAIEMWLDRMATRKQRRPLSLTLYEVDESGNRTVMFEWPYRP